MCMKETVHCLREDLTAAASRARHLFEQATEPMSRDAFLCRGGAPAGACAYAYFDEEGHAIYAGITSRSARARQYDQTSPHAKKDWWASWRTVRIMQLDVPEDREVLEYLLILAYAPPRNVRPGAVLIERLFEQCV